MSSQARQLCLYSDTLDELPARADTSSTFQDNLCLPVHRWFRYSAGFSAGWVRTVIERERLNGRTRVLDPFAGCGTVALEAEFCGTAAIGVEAHPFVARVARAKLNWHVSPGEFRAHADSVLLRAKGCPMRGEPYPSLLMKCFPVEALRRLDALRRAWESTADGSPLSELTWLALVSILRECSPVGTAQWQYVLPNKSKARFRDPFEAFEARILLFCHDMRTCQGLYGHRTAEVVTGDARDCSAVPDGWAKLVLTSPPYANNFDYADATRLEMTFMREVERWGDLQDAVRKHLIRSCTQHVATSASETDRFIEDPLVAPIRSELRSVCGDLELARERHGGKKPYHTMVAGYFEDMARAWVALRRVTAREALLCFVIGDSAPYGVHVPVDTWLGELALAAGFKSYSFERTRDRNVKWKNRKHRVPLHEGRLWVVG